MIAVVPDLGGQVKSNAQSRNTLAQEIMISFIAFSGRAETGILPHGPEFRSVHIGPYSPCIRKFAWIFRGRTCLFRFIQGTNFYSRISIYFFIHGSCSSLGKVPEFLFL